jgi:hypothetical protein
VAGRLFDSWRGAEEADETPCSHLLFFSGRLTFVQHSDIM